MRNAHHWKASPPSEPNRKLAEDVRVRLPLLFGRRGARIVSNGEAECENPRHFDFASASLATAELDLRFFRVRGEFTVKIAGSGFLANGNLSTMPSPGCSVAQE